MSKIIDEIKKISNDNKYDLNKFESVYDLITELEEEKENTKKEIKIFEDKEKETNKELEKIKNDYEELSKKNAEAKKQILDLKEKYIDRFNEPPKQKNDNNINTNITISDLFKEV